MRTIYEQNYTRLERIFGKNWHKINHTVLKNEPYMQLYFEKLDKDRFAMAHYFEQNGDLVPDPDMEILVNSENQTVEAFAYQDGVNYLRVYPEPRNRTLVDYRVKKSLNNFLTTWLKNIITQGFRKTA